MAFFLLLFSSGKSQIKIVVVDSVSRQPLAFATVYQFSGRSLFLCSNEGQAKLDISEANADTVRVSYAGYFDKIFLVNRFKDVEVRLIQNIKILPVVVLKPCADWSKNISYIPEADSGIFGGISWGNMVYKGRIALFLHPQAEGSKLVSFKLYFKLGVRGTKMAAKAPILFSFYSVDTSTMLPGELLTSKTILFHPKKLGPQEINVDSIGLIIPERGIYLAVDGYQDEKYSYLVPTKMPNGEVDTVRMYGAALDGMYTQDTWLSFYNFKTGQWFFGGNKSYEKNRSHGAIKYEMKYAICTD